MFTKYTTLIIPTRNRPKKVNHLLLFFKNNKLKFNQILLIDSSDREKKKYNFKIITELKVKIIDTYPSASHQRNLGIKMANKKSKYILFLDDDVSFYNDSFIKMDKVLEEYKDIKKLGGIAFNLITHYKENSFLKKIKNLSILRVLKLYSSSPGKVLQSGLHTKIENFKKDRYVEWLFSGATIYKKDIIKNHNFNESLGAYSYLEDLFFSYTIYKKGYKLLVPKIAKFKNPHLVERSNFNFGIKEIINRYKFVKKFNLNIFLFFILAVLRFFLSFIQIFKLKFNYFFRSLGNIYAFLLILLKIENEK